MVRFSGRRLREARTAAGIPPERLALAVERSVYSIHAYELGRIDPPASVVGALAGALGCSVADLYDQAVAA